MADVTITQGTVSHALSATTPDNPAAEIQPKHWNSAHAASFVLAAAVASALFSNANGMSFGLSDSAITGSYTVPTQSVQTQASGNIPRTGFTTTTVGGAVVAGTHDTAGILMAVPAYLTTYAAQSVQTQASGAIPRSGITTTTVAGAVVAGTHDTAGLLLAVPAYLTTAALSQNSSLYAGIGFTSTTTAGTEVKATVNTAGVSMAVPAYLTAAAGGGDGFNRIAAGTQTAGTNATVLFENSNGITFGMSDSTRITASHNGLTAQSVQTQASGNIPRSGFTTTTIAGAVVAGTHNTDGLLVAVPAYLTTAQAPGAYLTTARASNDAVGLNTALTANGVAWTVNSSGISLNVPAFLTTAALSGHSHGNPTLALTNLSGTTASASNGLTLSLSAAAPGGGAGATVSVVEIADGGRLTTCAVWNNATYSNRPIFVPFEIDNNLTGCHTIRLFASRSTGTLLVASIHAGIYSRPNATSASLLSSTSINVSVSTSAQYSGVRIYDVTGLSNLSLPPGRYLLGLLGSAAATNSIPLHLMGGDQIPIAGFVLPGTNSTAATATNSHIIPMWGVYTATSAGLPANVNNTQISGGNSVNSPDIYALIKAI